MAEDTKVVETNDEMKFTAEELQELQDLQTGYQEKQVVLGQLAVQRILLDQQSDALEARVTEVEQEYEGVQQQERDLVEKLNVKYGPGSLNPDTGVFTPAPPVEESPEV
jgi:predicted  nucleic acid-binding Zn-ribbon protein|tara:strand:- start:61 stop:387 length:327 start_codon:yes stop_codon:yes gene_type:complete